MTLSGWTWFGLALAVAAVGKVEAPSREPSIPELIAQLEDRSCNYASDPLRPCSETGLLYRWFYWLDPRAKYRCAEGAARCLESLGPRAGPAVPALIQALRAGPNDYDTGDGMISPRSAIAGALGAIGDPRAIDPLAEALRNAVPADRDLGALESREPAARPAIVEALGNFGPAAARHSPAVLEVLRERNADASFFERGRAGFENMEATSLASAEVRRRNPEGTMLVVPNDEIERARQGLDRSSAEYRSHIETWTRDALAGAAARALGRFGRPEATPILLETLRNPAAAEAAALALAELKPSSGAALDALHELLLSGSSFPGARRAAASAMGRLGDQRSVKLLARGLSDEEVGEWCARALVQLGPRSRAALPAMRVVLSQPSMARRSERGLVYSVEATRRLGSRIAVVRAIASLGGAEAFEALAPFVHDPDVGPAVRHALERLDPERSRALKGVARR